MKQPAELDAGEGRGSSHVGRQRGSAAQATLRGQDTRSQRCGVREDGGPGGGGGGGGESGDHPENRLVGVGGVSGGAGGTSRWRKATRKTNHSGNKNQKITDKAPSLSTDFKAVRTKKN